MKQLVFSPIDESYKVSYLTNLIGLSQNVSIYEIKSLVGSGNWVPGLCAEGQAAGLWDEYVELTLAQMKAKAATLNMNLRVYEDAELELNINTKLANFLTFSITDGNKLTVAATINHAAFTIAATVPFGTDPETLIPIFTTTNGATVEDTLEDPVISGETEVDMTAAVELTVVSYDKSVNKTYELTVTIAEE